MMEYHWLPGSLLPRLEAASPDGTLTVGRGVAVGMGEGVDVGAGVNVGINVGSGLGGIYGAEVRRVVYQIAVALTS